MTSSGSSRSTEHRFVSFDGTPIYFCRIVPSAPTRGAILIVHGMGEHGGRYAPIAEFLCARGFSCYLLDLRGFGKSGGKRGCLKHFADYFEDLRGVTALMREMEGRSDFFFLGHSYGGLVVSSFLAHGSDLSAKGLILSSPNFGISIRVPLWRRLLAYLASWLSPDYVQNNHVDPGLLTHDAEMLQKYKRDRLIHHFISARLYTELLSKISLVPQTAVRLLMPLLVLQAGDDRIVSRSATVGFYERAASSDKELEIYEGFYHEIFNETERLRVFERVAGWAGRRT